MEPPLSGLPGHLSMNSLFGAMSLMVACVGAYLACNSEGAWEKKVFFVSMSGRPCQAHLLRAVDRHQGAYLQYKIFSLWLKRSEARS